MKLALVSPLPPQSGVAARLAAALLPRLRAHARLRVLTTAPEQADAALADVYSVGALADLPYLCASGAIDLPVYLLADDIAHAHQIRYLREFPGLLVLLTPGVHGVLAAITEESGDLDAYRALLVEEHGAAARAWPERFLWRSDRDRLRRRLPLAGVVCRRSLAVLAPAPFADRLRHRCADVPIEALPPDDQPDAIAAAVVAMARRILDHPRVLPPFSQPDWPAVEVVVVGYNSRAIVGQALQAIAAQDYPDLTCTLVDNASQDGTAAFVRDNFPAVRVLEPGRNLGFAAGNNYAFARTSAKYVVLINQDAVARRDCIRELVRAAERDDRIGAVGAKMLMMRCPTILNSAGLVMNEGGFAVDRGIGEKDTDPSPIPERVLAVCGGAMLLRTAVLREIGMFDEAFFMYCEDVDLCWRMRLHGLEVLYAPLAVVVHDWHGDLDGAPERVPHLDTGGGPSAAGNDARTERRRMLCERNRMISVIKNVAPGKLLRTLVAMRRYDRIRLRNLRRAIAAGGDVAAARLVARAIHRANRWCRWRFPWLLAARRRVQQLCTVPAAAVEQYIGPGVHEPYHIGDLQIVNDRFSAEAPARLQMGVNDRRALGPGWHALEPGQGTAWGLRWSKGEAWAYVAAPALARRLCVRAGRGPLAVDLAARIGAVDLPPQPVPGGEPEVVVFPLPREQPTAASVEIHFACRTFRPSDTPGVADHRELGVRVAEVWFE